MFTRRWAVIAAILIGMALSSSIGAGYGQTEDEALKKGTSLVRHDKFDEAIAEFNKVIAADPKSASAYYNLGFAYDKKGDLAKAILNFTKAIEADPTLTDAYYNRGFVYYRKGDFDKAIFDYSKVIESSPDAADAYYGLGLAYSKKGDLDKAISEYTQAIKARPNFALAYDARAVAYVTKKNYLGALSDANRAQSLGFRSRPVRRAAGSGLANAGRELPQMPDSNVPDVALMVAGLIFLGMSIMQFIRVIAKAKIVVNDKIVIPLWFSMVASPVLLALSVYMFIASRQ